MRVVVQAPTFLPIKDKNEIIVYVGFCVYAAGSIFKQSGLSLICSVFFAFMATVLEQSRQLFAKAANDDGLISSPGVAGLEQVLLGLEICNAAETITQI